MLLQKQETNSGSLAAQKNSKSTFNQKVTQKKFAFKNKIPQVQITLPVAQRHIDI